MGRMIDGQWRDEWTPSDPNADGRFVRKDSVFRDLSALDPEPGRYHIYAAIGCPWAQRTILTRLLKRLDDAIDVHWCNVMTDKSWRFADDSDPLHGAEHLYELYLRADPHYTGRVTVPVLWDAGADTVVNNESSEIIRLLDALPSDAPRLAPDDLVDEIDAINERLYHTFNNGVYRAGFARHQEAYDVAVREVFDTLDWLESHLDGREWLVGNRLTEADIRLFVTAIRFDVAYHTLFKCNLRRIADYPNVQAHLERMYLVPGVAETCDLERYKRGYAAIRMINPFGIVPIGPEVRLGGI